MKILKYNEIITSDDDDFLYETLINLFNQIKLTQGGTALDSTLHRHPRLRNYCVAKQLWRMNHIEKVYFKEDGSLNDLAINSFNIKKRSLQNN